MRIIGYAFNADTHCIDCTHDAMAVGSLQCVPPLRCDTDENAVPYDLTDREGNQIHPIFDIDENAGSEYCGDCLAKLLKD